MAGWACELIFVHHFGLELCIRLDLKVVRCQFAAFIIELKGHKFLQVVKLVYEFEIDVITPEHVQNDAL